MTAEQHIERERFEAWWRDPATPDNTKSYRLTLEDMRQMAEDVTWKAWQARAALSHPSPAQGWPCEVVEADFSENTITLQMKDADYLVSAGEYRLSPPPEQGSKG